MEISTDGARGLSIPRLLLGMSCAKRRNDSIVSLVSDWVGLGYRIRWRTLIHVNDLFIGE